MKKIIIAAVAIGMFTNTAYASILGSTLLGSKYTKIADGTYLYENVFLSDQDGVGKQSEFYAEYEPNENILPTVISGESLRKRLTVTQAEQYMRDNGLVPMLGINASYFSYETGLPMGTVISEGIISTKDNATYQAIGFNSDGTAFIAPLNIYTSLSTEYGEVCIDYINKQNASDIPYIILYTDEYAAQTYNTTDSLCIVLEVSDGELACGESLTAVVSDKFEYDGSIALEEGKLLLSLNKLGAYPELEEVMNQLEVGDEVTITNEQTTDERWDSSYCAIGSVGDILVENGTVNTEFTKGASPRTAIGITESGSVIMYVIDGRQTGHSYGVQLKTLAKRMAELGCVDAINLDGGGSSVISGIYPGTQSNVVINKPSDGKPREDTNYIFLKNMQERTGELGHLYLSSTDKMYLTGAKEKLEVTAVDSAYYYMKTPLDVELVADNGSDIDKDGVITFSGDGVVTVTAAMGDVSDSYEYMVFETPEKINVMASRSIDTELTGGDVITFSATAEVNGYTLVPAEDSFKYSVEGEIGEITEDGVFTAIDEGNASGNVVITVGELSEYIPITVVNNVFEDTDGHWAKDIVSYMYSLGIISGYETDEGMLYMPDANMTRAEFAVLMSRYLQLDENSEGADKYLDTESIPEWARPHIGAMSELGFINGKQVEEGQMFCPNDTITRAEVIAIVGRTMPLLDDGELTFDDIDEIPEWAVNYAGRLCGAGVISGYDDNTLRPMREVTRAEAATVLYKLILE